MVIRRTGPFTAHHRSPQGVLGFAVCAKIRALEWFFQTFHNIAADTGGIFLGGGDINIEFHP